jgi:hypothetical protein
MTKDFDTWCKTIDIAKLKRINTEIQKLDFTELLVVKSYVEETMKKYDDL